MDAKSPRAEFIRRYESLLGLPPADLEELSDEAAYDYRDFLALTLVERLDAVL